MHYTLCEGKSRFRISDCISSRFHDAGTQGNLEGTLGLYHSYLIWLESAQLQGRSRKGATFHWLARVIFCIASFYTVSAC